VRLGEVRLSEVRLEFGKFLVRQVWFDELVARQVTFRQLLIVSFINRLIVSQFFFLHDFSRSFCMVLYLLLLITKIYQNRFSELRVFSKAIFSKCQIKKLIYS